jgi:hypothetical protein
MHLHIILAPTLSAEQWKFDEGPPAKFKRNGKPSLKHRFTSSNTRVHRGTFLLLLVLGITFIFHRAYTVFS